MMHGEFPLYYSRDFYERFVTLLIISVTNRGLPLFYNSPMPHPSLSLSWYSSLCYPPL
jgi:hypothetical protein